MKKILLFIILFFVMIVPLKAEDKTADLLNGQDFNLKIKELAGNIEITYEHEDEKINKILYAESIPEGLEFTDDNEISTENSSYPVYAWIDEDTDTIYYYSEADIIYLNPDSSFMFSGFSNLSTIDLSHIDTSKVTNMSNMFNGCIILETLNLSNFNTSNVTSMDYMFSNCYSLESLNISNFNTSKVEDMEGMFYGCESLTSLNLSNFNTSNVNTMLDMFNGCVNLETLNLSSFNTSKVENMADMFHSCSKLSSLNLNNFDTSNVTIMSGMFSGCSSLSSVNVDNFDILKVTDMGYMFNGCENLTTLDLSSFDTSNEPNMTSMFGQTDKLSKIYVRSAEDRERFRTADPGKYFSLKDVKSAPKVKVKNANNNTLLISWNEVLGAEKYTIYSSTDKKKWTKEKTTTDLSYTDKDLVYGKTYYYKVKAVGDLNSMTSSVVSGKTKPNKVILKTPKVGTNNVKLKWDKVSVSGYVVYSSTDNKKWTKIKTITDKNTLEYNNKKLKANKTYYYKVRAYKTVSGKKIYGSYSDVLKTKTSPVKPVVSLTSKDFDKLRFVVKSTKGASYYKVEVALTENFKEKESLSFDKPVDMVTDVIDIRGVTIYLRVKACNSYNNCSGWVVVSAKPIPKTPKISLETGRTIPMTINVSGANRALGFRVYRSTDNKKWEKIADLESSVTKYEDTKAKKNKKYYYKVRSYVKNSEGKNVYSKYSSVKSLTNLYEG